MWVNKRDTPKIFRSLCKSDLTDLTFLLFLLFILFFCVFLELNCFQYLQKMNYLQILSLNIITQRPSLPLIKPYEY